MMNSSFVNASKSKRLFINYPSALLNFLTATAAIGVRQPKLFYGPLFGLLMGLMFSKASARYQQQYDPSETWFVAEKPPHYSQEEQYSKWQPLVDPFGLTAQTDNFYSALSSGFGDETAAASDVYVRRRRPDASRRRSSPKRRSRPKRRKTTTTTEAYYYDDNDDYYDEYSEEVTRSRRRTTTPAYEDGDYSNEVFTKPIKKNKTKNQGSESASVELDETTTTKIAKQRQTTATTTTQLTTSTLETTTMGTSAATKFPGYNGTSNHDNITFTYGPPTGNDSHFGPIYSSYGSPAVSGLNWYSQFKSRNDVVKRVQDLIGEDELISFTDFQ